MPSIGELYYEFTTKGANDVEAQITRLNKQLEALSGTSKGVAELPFSSPTNTKNTNALADASKRLVNQAQATRNQFQAGAITLDQFKNELTETRAAAIRLSEGLAKDSAEFRRLTQAAASAQRGLDAASGKMNSFGLASQTALGFANGFRASLVGMVGPAAIGAAAVFGVERALNGVVSTGADFEKTMDRVGAVSGATSSELDSLASKARDLGANTAFSATEAADGLVFLAQAGLTVNEQLEAVAPSLNLAAAGNIELAESADILTNVMSQFSLEAAETSRVTNVIAATVTSANTDVLQFADAMNFLGPTANALGVSLEDASAVIAKLSDAGLQGSLGTRALGTSLVKLSKPTKAAREEIQKLGLEAFSLNGEFVGIPALIGQLNAAFADLTQEQQQAALSTIFGNESIQEFNILLNEGQQELESYSKSLTDAGNIAERVAEQQLDNFSGRVRLMNSAFSELSIIIFEALQPALEYIVNALTETAKVISGVLKSFNELDSGVKTIIGTSATAITALAGLALAFNTANAAAKAANAQGLTALGRGLTAFIGPAGLFAAVSASGAIWALSIINQVISIYDSIEEVQKRADASIKSSFGDAAGGALISATEQVNILEQELRDLEELRLNTNIVDFTDIDNAIAAKKQEIDLALQQRDISVDFARSERTRLEEIKQGLEQQGFAFTEIQNASTEYLETQNEIIRLSKRESELKAEVAAKQRGLNDAIAAGEGEGFLNAIRADLEGTQELLDDVTNNRLPSLKAKLESTNEVVEAGVKVNIDTNDANINISNLGSSVSDAFKFAEGSIGFAEEALSKLNEQLKSVTTQEERIQITLDIEAAETALESLKNNVIKTRGLANISGAGATSPFLVTDEVLSSNDRLKSAIDDINTSISDARKVTPELAAEFSNLGVNFDSVSDSLLSGIAQLENLLPLYASNEAATQSLKTQIALLKTEFSELSSIEFDPFRNVQELTAGTSSLATPSTDNLTGTSLSQGLSADTGNNFLGAISEATNSLLSNLSQVRALTPQVATELNKMGVQTGTLETALLGTIAGLEEQAVLLSNEQPTAEAQQQLLALQTEIAKLKVELNNLNSDLAANNPLNELATSAENTSSFIKVLNANFLDFQEGFRQAQSNLTQDSLLDGPTPEAASSYDEYNAKLRETAERLAEIARNQALINGFTTSNFQTFDQGTASFTPNFTPTTGSIGTTNEDGSITFSDEFSQNLGVINGELTKFVSPVESVQQGLLSLAGQFPLVNGALQGFATGGPIGAAVAIFAELVAETEGFQTLLSAASKLFGALVKVLDPLISLTAATIVPVVEFVANALEGLAGALAEFVKFITFGAIDLTNSGTPETTNEASNVTTNDSQSVTNSSQALNTVNSPLFQQIEAIPTVIAGPDGFSAFSSSVDLFGSFVSSFGSYVDSMPQRINVTVSGNSFNSSSATNNGLGV